MKRGDRMGLLKIDKRYCSLLALFISLLCPGLATAGVTTEIVVNKSVLINLQNPSERVSIATPAIAELIVISPTQMQINGTKIGTTSLIIWERGGKTSFFDIRVKGDISNLERQIQEIAPHDSITVDYANDTIVLAGKAANDQTIAKAVEIATAYAAKVAAAPGNAGGASAFPQQNDASDKKSDSGSALKVLNHIAVDEPQQVLLEVKVAQVDKNALKSLGISAFAKGKSGEGFYNTIGAPDGRSQGSDTPGTGIAGDSPWMGAISPLSTYQLGGSLYKAGIGVVINALVTKNLAKVLAEPNLLVKSGQEGKFMAGSKIPIQVVSGVGAISGTSIQFIDVGVKINFKPVVMENGLISLKIDPAEVSSVSGTLAVNGYPIIDTREIRTEVQLKPEESLVLAGLLQEETIKTMSKVPLLGDIPILGALFRSTQDDLKSKELVFFITPKIVKANAPGTVLTLPSDKASTPEQEKELRWMPVN